MDEFLTLPAWRQAQLIHDRVVSPLELAKAHVRQIEQVNSKLNAIVTLNERWLQDGLEAEGELKRGVKNGPLLGVPVTIKDTIDTAGLRTTSGSTTRADRVPSGSAPAVKLLKGAGAIILGKTNTSELALTYDTDNPVFGRTNNPYDVALTPGGSSGGCAAAISSCMSAAGLGSDLAGSIRIPAHCCGITGFKPESGRIEAGGHFPEITGSFKRAASLGPLARFVADLRLFFSVLSAAGDNTADVIGPANLRGVRFASFMDQGIIPVSDETRAAVDRAATIFKEGGMVQVRENPPGFSQGPSLWLKLFSAPVTDFLEKTFEGCESQAGPAARAVLMRPAIPIEPEVCDARDRLRGLLMEWMKSTPLILAPVGAVPALPHNTRKIEVAGRQLSVFSAFGYSQIANVFDLPAISLPANRTLQGLPISIQLIGRPRDEERLFAAASMLEEACGGWKRPMNL